MTTAPRSLPQIDERIFLTDGGLETTLVFLQGVDLPCFASFPLLLTEAGREELRRYFAPYFNLVAQRDVGFILDTATWRANPDWGASLGFSSAALDEINAAAVAFAATLRDRSGIARSRILVNGVVGPRGDGYQPGRLMSADEAQAYHAPQIRAFRDAGADMVSAVTMNYAEEATGVVRAAAAAGMPVVNSFTVETDGALATGESLRAAIERVDRDTGFAAAYHMVNCAHPAHFDRVMAAGEAWTDRIRGVRANASQKSHAELDAATELDAGDPADLGRRYRDLRGRLRRMAVLGGCCGADHRHVAAICEACTPAAVAA